MPYARKQFSAEENAFIITHYTSMTYADMARCIDGASESTVRHHADELGLRKRADARQARLDAVDECPRWMCYQDVMRRTGLSRQAVYQAARTLGVKFERSPRSRDKHLSPEDLSTLMADIRDRKSLSECADDCGCSKESVFNEAARIIRMQFDER